MFKPLKYLARFAWSCFLYVKHDAFLFHSFSFKTNEVKENILLLWRFFLSIRNLISKYFMQIYILDWGRTISNILSI